MKRALLRVVGAALFLAAWSFAQGTPENPPQAEPQEQEEESRQRIVDPATIQREPVETEPGRIERGLNYAEQTNLPERLALTLAHKHIRPTFGSLGDGSGFGLGVMLSTADKFSQHISFETSVHGTLKRYFLGTAGINFHDRAKPEERRFELALLGASRVKPQEDFWGLGPNSPQVRTNYDLQERAAGAEFRVRPHKYLSFGGTAAYSSTSIFTGKDDRFADTRTTFPTAILVGLGGVEYFTSGGSIAFDTREGVTNPVKDLFAEIRLASNDDLGSTNLSFWSYHADVRTYVPLGSPHRVLATRTLLMFNEPKAGADIPFYRLAQLGNSETLRGFDSQRFYGRHAAAWNVEYRLGLTGGLGAFAFTDFGQVFNRAAEFGRDNFRVTWGGGLSFQSKRSVLMRVYYAKSEESSRIFFTFGPTF